MARETSVLSSSEAPVTEEIAVYVSVGSNVERERFVREAVALLREAFGELVLSSVYETEPVGFAGQSFFNLVAGFATQQSVVAVVSELRRIENCCGRVRNGSRHSSRTMDIDLLLYGELVTDGPPVALPRDEIVTRAFVLGPLAEIASNRIHPGEKQNYADLWSKFDDTAQRIRKIEFAL